MKFLVLFSALAMPCVTAKSWHGDTYAAESTWTLGWFGYFRRMFIIAVLLLAIILYYVPQARPHARRACFIMIDIIASSLKLALGANEAEFLLDEIKSEATSPGGPRSLHPEKAAAFPEMPENSVNLDTPRRNRITAETATGTARQREGRSIGSRFLGDERSHGITDHFDRIGVTKDAAKSRTEYLLPTSPRSEKLIDVKKYLRSRLAHVKEFESTNLDNYIILISRNPWQAGGMRDKYAKNDLVILHDGPSKLDFKDSYTWTGRASTKHLESVKSKGTPRTRKNSDEEKGEGVEYESKGTAESKNSKYSDYKTNQYQSGEYEVSNYSRATMRVNDDATPLLTSTVTKSPRNETRNKYRSRENYTPMKSHDDSNERTESNQSSSSRRSSPKEEEKHGEKSLKRTSRTSGGNEKSASACCCSGTTCCKESAVEGEDETSEYKEVITANYDLDERPERESSMFAKSLENELIFDCELDRIPLTMSHTKPTLLRAVDWLFGSCPGAAGRDGQQHQQQQSKVGKEESKGAANGWLL